MFSNKIKRQIMAVVAGAVILAATTAQAAITPVSIEMASTPDIQLAWCAVGAHIGPLGACIGGPGRYYGRPAYYSHPGYGYRHCWSNHWGHRICN